MTRTLAYVRKDAFHQRAKREGYRSRAAYKLAEIADRRRLLRPGQRVVDLGCWPGGWLQVAGERVGPSGRVVGMDLRAVDPPLPESQVVSLVGDFSEPGAAARIREALGGPAQVVISDAAPQTTGVRATDRAREEALLQSVAAIVPELLAPRGSLLLKLLDCPEADEITRGLRGAFARASAVRASASRKGSKERYFLALDYRPDA